MTGMEDGDDAGERVDETPEDDTEYRCDWKELTLLFNTRITCLDIYCIDFAISTEQDRKSFKPRKDVDGKPLYTASFFCKRHDDWFIYRTIVPFEGQVTKDNMPTILEFLASKASLMRILRKRTKDPLSYFRDICLPKDI